MPTKSGFEFLGWSTSSTATIATYMKESTYEFISDVTLYAVWSQSYKCTTGTLTYNATYGASRGGYICVTSANQVDNSECVRYGNRVSSISDSYGSGSGTNYHNFGDTSCNNYGDSYDCTTFLAPYSNCTLRTIIYDGNGNKIADTGGKSIPCCDYANCTHCYASHVIQYYCEEYRHSYSYSCPSGWNTYTSSSQCYKAATLN